MEYKISTDSFLRHKSFLDGYVFYYLEQDYIVVRQVIPHRDVKKLLLKL